MEQRRLVLAALLSLAVLIVWNLVFPPPPPEEGGEIAVQEPAVVQPAPSVPSPAPPEGAGEVPPAPPGAAGMGDPLPELEPVSAASEETVVVETARFSAVFSNRGAQLISFELRDHYADDPEARSWGQALLSWFTGRRSSDASQPVNLVRRRPGGPWPFALQEPDGTLSRLNDVLFAVERERSAGVETVRFRYRGAEGEASKEFRFGGDGLFDVTVRRPGTTGSWSVLLGPGVRNPSSGELGNTFAQRTAVYYQGGELERVDVNGQDETSVVPGPALRWAGLQDTYFLTVLAPRSGLEGVVMEPMVTGDAGPDETPAGFVPLATAPESEGVRELALWFRAAGEVVDASAYFGAKVFDRLATFGLGLEDTVDRGMFSFIVGPLHWGLVWIHDNLVANYGWAIVLMTALIKILLFPLTFKSMTSMQRMQEVNPKIQAIRKKYQGKLKDKQGRPNAEAQRKMNEEVMALYKAEGVNPAGGCLPMLLQIPILFAFYKLLYTAVELRHAPWFGAIADLSAADPSGLLPIVMGATQFLQQKVTPASGDPMQRRIFMLMPVIFTVMFFGFPSGLVLYWLTNNVLTIVQQLIYNRVRSRAAAA